MSNKDYLTHLLCRNLCAGTQVFWRVEEDFTELIIHYDHHWNLNIKFSKYHKVAIIMNGDVDTWYYTLRLAYAAFDHETGITKTDLLPWRTIIKGSKESKPEELAMDFLKVISDKAGTGYIITKDAI